MTYESQKYHRRSIRLKGYDYAQAGAYFLAICTENRECLFGEIVDGTMRLSECGEIVQNEWLRTPAIRPEVELDAFVVMPNHIHGIVVIHASNIAVGAYGRAFLRRAGDNACRGDPAGRPYAPNHPRGPAPGSIGAIIGQFKSAVTKQINALRGIPHAPVWQRNYYERIIRSEAELNSIRQYIVDNPAQWEMDENNPNRQIVGGEQYV